MIKKQELKDRIADLEGRLDKMTKVIAKYYPFADDLEALYDTLTKMGLESARIMELFHIGQTREMNALTNPDTGVEYAVHYVKVAIEKNETTGHYEIYIENKPYAEFFQQELTNKAELDKLAAENPMVKEMFEENERMKYVLSHKK